MQSLVTVIIPVYNNLKTLKKCVNSVLSQTYSNLEIILVDDGSNDSSENLCDKYMEADSRISVFHTANEGVASARNLGIKEAKGKYIAFIDADDHIDPEYIEKLVSEIEKENCVMAMCNAYDVREDDFSKRIFSKTGKCSVKEFLEDTFYCRAEGGTCWGKIYRTSDIKYLFRGYNYCEDAFFVVEYLLGCKGYVSIIPEHLYYYVRREDSITGAKKIPDLADALYASEGIRDLCIDKFPKFTKSANAFLVNNAFFVYLNSCHDQGPEGESLREKAADVVRKYRLRTLLSHKTTFKTKMACRISFVSYGLLSYLYGRIC